MLHKTNQHLLEQFEWHDLPLEALCIQEKSISFIVTPYNEEVKDYDKFEFVISKFTKLWLSIESECSIETLLDLEITNFSYIIDNERISGEIEIIPSDRGYWKVKFENAAWQLIQST